MQWGKYRTIDGLFQTPLVKTGVWEPIRHNSEIAEIYPGDARLNGLWSGRLYSEWNDDNQFSTVMSALTPADLPTIQ